MKINKCLVETSNTVPQSTDNHHKKTNPSFKGAGFNSVLNLFGNTMQGIENGGFLASFLIQDALGMTAPRVVVAFLRDKEVTGHYNKQEGFEVLGREGLTGPCMMAVAPIMFALSARFGKTTTVNTQLIRRFGNSLREMVSKPNFDRTLLSNKDKFKNEFFESNIRDILKNTLGENNVKEESVQFILDRISKYEKIPADAKLPKGFLGIGGSKSKYKSQCLADITEHINNIKYTTSNDLNMLDKVKVGSDKLNNIRQYSTTEAIEAMIKYSDDAIAFNKNLNKLDENMAENIKDSSVAKRFFANISTIIATLGVMSFLPKIYAKSDIAPGNRTAMELKENSANKKQEVNSLEENSKEEIAQNVSFKSGKKPNSSWLSKFGKFISKHTNENFSSELEYNGHNFTNTLMTGLSLFGLLAPRGYRAYSRAQVDDNGKKDLTELFEILIRDVTSSLSVVFAVPMLTRLFVTSYENKSGFVLMHKDRTKSKLAKMLDLINPYSSSHVLTNSEINSLYDRVNSKEKMLNFCEYINQNGGDLEKILSKSENIKLFEEKGLDLKEMANLSKADKNRKISDFIKNLGKDSDEIIKNVMSTNKPKANAIRAFARNLNSIPGVITTFLISPFILGVFIPRLTYANTRRMHEKAEQENQEKARQVNTAA